MAEYGLLWGRYWKQRLPNLQLAGSVLKQFSKRPFHLAGLVYLQLVDTKAFLFRVMNRIIQTPDSALKKLLSLSGILLVKL